MAHPIVETKWQLDKIRELLNQLDTELDEAEYQANQAEEAIEQASKWEEAKEEAVSLVQQIMYKLDPLDVMGAGSPDDLQEIHDGVHEAYDLLIKLLKELEK